MDYVLIVNPTAGSGFALKAEEEAERAIRKRGMSWKTFHTEYPGHATKLAREIVKEGNAGAVIAVGGDGTVREVAAGVTGSEIRMGIIPAGTGNDYIKSVGIPGDPVSAIHCIFERKASPVDTGVVNNDFFLNVCGTGFDVTVLDYAEKRKTRHRGLTPYILGLLEAIFHYKPVRLTVIHDGVREEGEKLICSIANGRYIGGGIPICPLADPTDGKMNLVMIGNVPRWKIPFYLPGLMMARDLDFRVTNHCMAEEIMIEGKGLRINIDGEIKTMDKARFRIHPASLWLIH